MPYSEAGASRRILPAACVGVLALLLAACAAPPPAPQAAGSSPAARLAAAESLYPPWQRGANDDAPDKGFDFTVPPIDVLADFHGNPGHPALSLFVGGNYFFAMAPLVAAFGREHPRYAGRIYYETLPPGVLERQMQNGGTITAGNMTWKVKADVYLAGLGKVRTVKREGLLTGAIIPYVTNDLTIMIPAGNPGRVESLRDLGRPDLAVALSNPEFEGVARQIRASLVKAGGPALAHTVYDVKVKNGTTILTRVHHRQTPLFLMQGLVQAGVTWTSEAIFQERIGHAIANIPIPPEQNTRAIYAAAMAAGAPHPQAAAAWLAFIRSDAAFAIFQRYGFQRYAASSAGD